MTKELVISATPHETRVAILEEGHLCEIYVEREKEFALVGSIYKGRVTRVLPGMQSAFVDIGLDTDAFLYVSDFLEDLEEYDQVVHAVETKIEKMEEQGGRVFEHGAADAAPASAAPLENGKAQPAITEPPSAPPAERPQEEFRPPRRHDGREGRRDARGFGRDSRGGRRGRWGRRGGRNRRDRGELPPSKYAPPRREHGDSHEPVILPGESLAKYRDRSPAGPSSEPPSTQADQADAGDEIRNLSAAPAVAAESFDVPAPEAAASAASAAESFVAHDTSTELTDPNAPRTAEESPTSAEISTEAAGAVEAPESSPPAEIEDEIVEATESDEAESSENDEEAGGPSEEEHETHDEAELDSEDRMELEGAASEQSLEESDAHAAEPATEWDESEAPRREPEASDDDRPQPPSRGQEFRRRARFDSGSRVHLQRPMRRSQRRRARRSEGFHQRDREQRRPQLISEMLKAGQEIIVQIAKEPLGKKGARITSHVALPGRFLVYMPTLNHIGVSRKIESSAERARLRRTVLEKKGNYPGGFIVRTAASGASEEDLGSDVEYLGRTWTEMLGRAEQRKAPTLLHRDLNLIERILRDHLSPDFTSIWIDNEEEFTKVVEFVGRFQPEMVNRVKLFTKPAPIFEEFGIQQEIDKSLRPKVWLKSGGYIVINHTEALVAIDVNTGKYVGKGSTRLEDTIVKTNVEAVKEIVRQIRLRDLGGIIVVDFIDMEEKKNRHKVMQALEEALRSDRAPSKVLGFNEFGLVAITRKRTKQALERVLCQPCPYCTGSGMVKSVPTICYEIQTEARKMAAEVESASLTLRVHPEIAKALKTRESPLIDELEQWTRKSVIIQADPALHWEQYDIY